MHRTKSGRNRRFQAKSRREPLFRQNYSAQLGIPMPDELHIATSNRKAFSIPKSAISRDNPAATCTALHLPHRTSLSPLKREMGSDAAAPGAATSHLWRHSTTQQCRSQSLSGIDNQRKGRKTSRRTKSRAVRSFTLLRRPRNGSPPPGAAVAACRDNAASNGRW